MPPTLHSIATLCQLQTGTQTVAHNTIGMKASPASSLRQGHILTLQWEADWRQQSRTTNDSLVKSKVSADVPFHDHVLQAVEGGH